MGKINEVEWVNRHFPVGARLEGIEQTPKLLYSADGKFIIPGVFVKDKRYETPYEYFVSQGKLVWSSLGKSIVVRKLKKDGPLETRALYDQVTHITRPTVYAGLSGVWVKYRESGLKAFISNGTVVWMEGKGLQIEESDTVPIEWENRAVR